MSLLGHPRFMEGVDLHKQGRFDEAGKIYQELIEANPNDPDLWHFKGLLALHMGNAEEAIRFASLAATLKPAMPDYYQTMAIAHEAAGQKEKAGEVFNKLGNALQEQCRFAEAVEAYSYSLHLNPGFAGTMINRGSALTRLGRYAEGAADFNAALAQLGAQTEISGLLNIANALSGLGRAEDAIAVYTQLLAIDPDHATAHCSRALLKLRLGLMPDAWEEYEWRWNKAGGFREPRGQFRQKMWQGESPGELGGALLVIAEQGLGDVIQFARYIPLLADQGYDIIFETLPELTTLFVEGFDHPRIRVVGRIDNPLEVESNLPFAAWTGVMSLPARFHTTLETIPATVPYISIAPEKVKAWEARLHSPLPAGEAVSLSRSGLGETGEGHTGDPLTCYANAKGISFASSPAGRGEIKIGIAWSGNPKNLNDFARSIPPQLLEPLLAAPNVTFYSLQKGLGADYVFENPPIRLADELTDLTQTAAAITAFDLVITVDTSICHLAGALGKPVWLLIPVQPDWRWVPGDGETTPWYPTMRIFRQTMRGQWPEVIAAAQAALVEMVG